jgi:predicted PurR-regulated permease PerM
MRLILIFFLVFFFLIYLASPVSAQELDKLLKNEPGAAELTEEDKEIIRNLDEIENLDWLVDTDLDLLENLDLFLTNS